MRILITGAGGQLGHDLVETLTGHELRPLTHAQLDISDEAAVASAVRAAKPQVIINSAAYNDVDGAENNEALAFAVNGAGAGYLAKSARTLGARLVHISTDYVFDGRKGSAYDEDDAPNPLSVYARSKRQGEERVLDSKADACVLRTAWLYGRQGKNFVKAILAAAERGGPLKVVADQVGSPTATQDLAGAIAALLKRPAGGLLHAVNAGACSRYEFARAIVGDRVAVQPISTKEADRPAPRPANSSLVSRRWAALGLPPMRSWEDALADFLKRS